MKIDFIGDIHGHADELFLLLNKLGYNNDKGYYSHTEGRKVIFVGDFIDRGPKIMKTLQIVKGMCDNNTAEAVMGNHEYNAILFHTKNKNEGGFFREHGFKEINQHFETLKQFQHHSEEWQMYIEWFKKLPLFIDSEHYGVVHAYWNKEYIDYLNLNSINWNEECLEKLTDENTIEYKIVEELLKGREFKLPNGCHFFDKDNIKREECRIKWWHPINEFMTYGDYLFHCPDSLKNENIEILTEIYPANKPIFFGHYWLSEDEPKLSNSNAICLDYSIAKNGHLVAYSLDTEKFTIQKSIS
jgi:hypothetical protein